MSRPFYRREDRRVILPLAGLILGCAAWCGAYYFYLKPAKTSSRASGIIPMGRFTEARKIHREGDRQYLWAGGPSDPEDPESDWFDLSGAPLPIERFQYGIGRDQIASIDEPVFVKPDDPRLAAYWKERGFEDLNKLSIIGYAHDGEAKAYPRALLDHHELVNDTVGGKPVTVGW